MLRRISVNALGIDRPAERRDFLTVLGDPQPAMNHRLVDFQMKLKAVDVVAVTKRLVGAQGRKGEMASAFGDIEGFAMPLKDFLRCLKHHQ